MSESNDVPTDPIFDEVFEASESAPRDRSGHGKQPPRLNDDELAHRTEQERVEIGIDDYDPDEVPPATN
jgi:hypothetical protein